MSVRMGMRLLYRLPTYCSKLCKRKSNRRFTPGGDTPRAGPRPQTPRSAVRRVQPAPTCACTLPPRMSMNYMYQGPR